MTSWRWPQGAILTHTTSSLICHTLRSASVVAEDTVGPVREACRQGRACLEEGLALRVAWEEAWATPISLALASAQAAVWG